MMINKILKYSLLFSFTLIFLSISAQTQIDIECDQTSKGTIVRIRDKFDDDIVVGCTPSQNIPYTVSTDLNFLLFTNIKTGIVQPIYLTSKQLKVKLNEFGVDSFSNAPIFFNNFLQELNNKNGFANFGYQIYDDFMPIKIVEKPDIRLKHKSFLLSYNEQRDALENYKQIYRIDTIVEKRILKDIEELYMLRFLIPFTHWNIDSLSNNSEFLSKIYSFRERIVNNTDKDEKSGQYTRRLAYYYNRFLNRKNMGTSLEFTSLWDTASNLFQGDTRQFLRFNLLKKYYKKDIKNYEDYVKEFFNTSGNEDYNVYLKKMYFNNERNFSKEELDCTLTDANGYTHTLRQILENLKNKNKYLSFWASWCSPCRKEMENYAEFASEFLKYETESVFISTDKSIIAWKSAISLTGTQQYHHYRLEENSILFKTLDVNSLPRHVLVDKQNQIYRFYAPQLTEKIKLTPLLKTMPVIKK